MAIAFDAITNSSFSASSPLTFSHTTSGDDRLLVVYVYDGNNNVTGVTYNGVSMTATVSLAMPGAATGQTIRMFHLTDPASGANNVVVTASSTPSMYATAVSYTGVLSTGQPDATNSNSSTSTTSLTTSVTTTADNCWLMGYSYMQNSLTAGTGTVLRGGPVAGVLQAMDSDGPTTPAGSDSLITTQSPADFGGSIVASFAPVVTTGSTSDFFLMF